jgi:glucosamine--fructose-6-phosphate aminotransferase (isomerizing)
MCGIVGIITNDNKCTENLLNGLKNLQNRGYDSAGICTIHNNTFILHKYASNNNANALNKLDDIKELHANSKIGVGHTRWATHGGKTDENSHPHISSDNKFAVVHNGIIENFSVLKSMLQNEGYEFKSQTDSEVVSNLLAYNYKNAQNNTNINNTNNINNNIITAINETISQLEGTWGLVIMCTDNENELYCTKNGSPLLIGQTNNYVMATSEQSGFNEKIKNYIVLKNYDVCVIKKESTCITVQTNHAYNFKPITVQMCSHSPDPYLHWTLKEIYEQKDSTLRAISFGGRIISNESVKLGGLELKREKLLEIDNIILLGCGTSYNACLLGIHYLKELCNFNTVQVFDGAEFNINDVPKKGKIALILLSQSGETKDLHRCIHIAKSHNLFTIGVVNVVDSLIAREVDCGCYLNAGKEVAVASTKSFTSQVIVLSMIAIWFAQNNNINKDKRIKYIADLYNLNFCINEIFNNLERKIENILPLFGNNNNNNSCFVLGKGQNEAIAHEASLKIKEISYIHCEGYSSSSLKHGPFALLCDNFPVILIMPNDEHYAKNVNAYHEIKSRNANIIVITNKEFNDTTSNVIYIPFNETYNSLLSIIPLQMLAYKLSLSKGINPDMPKNLAKVVTVE